MVVDLYLLIQTFINAHLAVYLTWRSDLTAKGARKNTSPKVIRLQFFFFLFSRILLFLQVLYTYLCWFANLVLTFLSLFGFFLRGYDFLAHLIFASTGHWKMSFYQFGVWTSSCCHLENIVDLNGLICLPFQHKPCPLNDYC